MSPQSGAAFEVPSNPGAEVTEVDGFAIIERAWLQRLVPGFDWRRFASPSTRHRLAVPLGEATIGLVSTCGAHLGDQAPFNRSRRGDPSFREIPADTEVGQLQFSHAGYDVRNAYADPDCVFPLDLLRRLADEGLIGGVAARAYSLMGYATQTEVLLEETGPALAQAMTADGVDLAFLVPA
jgi:D-proline reductase (dithiol) PrdB